jgi:hypothetical protein
MYLYSGGIIINKKKKRRKEEKKKIILNKGIEMVGIEPTSTILEIAILPLNYI